MLSCVNVALAGAVGDGMTVNTETIQNALDSLTMKARKNAGVGVSAGKMVDRSFRVEIEREDCFGWSEKFSRGGEIDRFVAYRRLERASVFTFG